MPEDPLVDASDLPLVLVGPMLRRVTSTSVSVFLVLKEATSVGLQVGQTTAGGFVPEPAFEGGAATVALGRHVHVVVVTAKAAAGGLGRGVTYNYEVRLTRLNGTFEEGLSDQNVLAKGLAGPEAYQALCFDGQLAPSFVLPSADLNHVRLLHASCRKPHGGEEDGLSIVDHIIGHDLDPARRVQQLWLTGDQIYADDVHPELLGLILDVQAELFGWPDSLTDPLPLETKLGPGERADFTLNTLEMSYGSKDANAYHASRLLFFQEYCLMYMLVWSDVLWLWTSQTNMLPDFMKGMKSVRRALANIPTYMMFDDHEFTDDFLLNLHWVDKVVSASNHNARAVLGNGMAAYAIFQHWGNAAQDFEAGTPGRTLLDLLDRDPGPWTPGPQAALLPISAPDWVSIRNIVLPQLDTGVTGREYTDQLVHGQGSLDWHYHYQEAGLPFEVLVLDTRTRRSYPAAGSDGAGFPGLISADALLEMIPSIAGSPDGDPNDILVTIVLSPPPVSGVRFIEHKQTKQTKALKQLEYDAEAWGLDLNALQRLLHRLASRGPVRAFGHKVVFLSGDVHYGLSQRISYWYRGLPHNPANPRFDPNPLVAAQLTSSALKNTVWTSFLWDPGNMTLHHTGYAFGSKNPWVQKVLGWDAASNPNASGPILHRSLLWGDLRARHPATGGALWHIQLDYWTNGKDIKDTMGGAGFRVPERWPDWQYRIDSFGAFPKDDAIQNLPSGMTGLGEIIEDSDQLGRMSTDGDGMQIVALPNVGFVEFEWSANDNERFVRHDLWYRFRYWSIPDPFDLEDPGPLARFKVPLGASYRAPGATEDEFVLPELKLANEAKIVPSRE